MTNEEIVEQIQQGINVQDNLTELYLQNKNFIYKIAKPYMEYAEKDDLLQEGWIGFQESIATYKHEEGGAKFLTYAAFRIKMKCIRYLEKDDLKQIPAYMKTLIRKYQDFIKSYDIEHGEEPSDAVIMDALEIKQTKLDNIRKAIIQRLCISIFSSVPGTENIELQDTIEDPSSMEEYDNVEEKLFLEHERKVLDEAIAELPEKQAKVIRCKYFENCTQVDIAKQMKVTNSYIGQLEQKSIEQLRKQERLLKLKEEKYGYDSSRAFGIGRDFALDHHTSCTEILAVNRVIIDEERARLTEQKKIEEDFLKLLKG